MSPRVRLGKKVFFECITVIVIDSRRNPALIFVYVIISGEI